MEIQASISDLVNVTPREPFIVYGTVKCPKRMPGAIIAKNPYVATAKFLMGKNAAEKDIKITAEQIVDEITEVGNLKIKPNPRVVSLGADTGGLFPRTDLQSKQMIFLSFKARPLCRISISPRKSS